MRIILNGMRHRCDACHLVSILAVKGDPTIGGHGYNTEVTLTVPINDRSAQTEELNLRTGCSFHSGPQQKKTEPCYRIRRFCVADRRGPNGPLAFTPRGGGTYRTADGRTRRVPPHAWCRPRPRSNCSHSRLRPHHTRNGLVDAWIRIDYQDPMAAG